ncbi:unnamed protein product [Triticum turgidum subsp. durum]|uniref:SOSEKI DIX-like domain-containing protein n=1 Tax=Triticum turgidum subsp. durum TaxID=4567 RepID=A0A9R0RS43_TRITD|nr:unnamed protein product [Triticum turgidum subsp. durum]
MRMMNPSMMVSRLDLWFLELAAARVVFHRLPSLEIYRWRWWWRGVVVEVVVEGPRPRPGPARVAVVYYLSRNGQLEHPHFMEVALSSPDGLYLRDVIDRLDALRGKGMARMYSWASKRSYRNGFVWHDLADDDYVHPVGGREYVLKGTERLHPPAIHLPLLDAAAASSCSSGSHDTTTSSSSGWDHGAAKIPPGVGVLDRWAGKAEEAVDLHDRCIPRKPKSKKDGYQVISCTAAHASGKRVGA